jgi:hypothetical protein
MNLPEYWENWARTLQQNHLTGFVITLLEGASPVRMILAQTLFGVSPFFGTAQQASFRAFAETLDDSLQSQNFASFLKNLEIK